jgi:hypothetical protein
VDINITIFHIPVNKKTSTTSISINKPDSLPGQKLPDADSQAKTGFFSDRVQANSLING